MEQFLDSDTETSDVETIEITETSESDVETIENTDSYLKISVRVEHGKIQKPRSRNWKNFGRNKWKGRNNKRIVETGVNSEGNYYTVFSDGSYRYDNHDGYHYKNSNGNSTFFYHFKMLKNRIQAAHSLEKATVKFTRLQMAKDGPRSTIEQRLFQCW